MHTPKISKTEFISDVFKKNIAEEQHVKEAFDRIFSDEIIQKEQVEWTLRIGEANARDEQTW